VSSYKPGRGRFRRSAQKDVEDVRVMRRSTGHPILSSGEGDETKLVRPFARPHKIGLGLGTRTAPITSSLRTHI
jgi:hypothetical protein